MKIKTIIFWIISIGIKVAYFIITGGWVLPVIGLVCDLLGLMRFIGPKEYKVIDGFNGNKDVGHYEYDDNAIESGVGCVTFVAGIVLNAYMFLNVVGLSVLLDKFWEFMDSHA